MPDNPPELHSESSKRPSSFVWRASWEHRKRLLRVEVWVLVVCSYVLLIFAYAWPADFRNTATAHVAAAWSAAILRTFMFHGGILLAVVGAVVAFARSWRLLAAITPLLLVTLVPSVLSYWPWKGGDVQGETLTVMSVNLLMVNHNTAPIIQEIKAARPDILLLQEYTKHWHEALQLEIGADFPHVSYVTREDSFGAAVYSRRPFVERPNRHVPLGEATEPQIRITIEFNGSKVALYNVHLLPPWGLAYTIEHRSQFADLLDILAADPLPVIVGGDFNFTENSANAAALSKVGLADAHSVGGWGRGTTWPVSSFFRWIPSIRLDHIYLGNGLTCAECRTGTGTGSDHRPVVAKIGFSRSTD